MKCTNMKRFFCRLVVLGAMLALVAAACQPPAPPEEPDSPVPTPSPDLATSPLESPIDPPPSGLWPSGRVLYHSDETGVHQIYKVVDGASAVRLTEPPLSAVEASWSPDGTMIAFAAEASEGNGIEIYVMDGDGSNPRRVMDEQPRLNWRPSWSPDGSQLLFQSNRDGRYEIYRVDVDGTSLINLTDHRGNDRDAAWSPLGDRIAFVSDRDAGDGNALYLMNPDGSDVSQILDSSWNCAFPQWSPDGSQLAFASRKEGPWHIFVMDFEGGEPRKVTSRVGDNVTPNWVGADRLIFSGEAGDLTWDLFVINVDGTGQIQLTDTIYSERFPDWAP